MSLLLLNRVDGVDRVVWVLCEVGGGCTDVAAVSVRKDQELLLHLTELALHLGRVVIVIRLIGFGKYGFEK